MSPRLKCGSSQEIEHYTVICFCTGNFIEYNDLLTSEKIKKIFWSKSIRTRVHTKRN